MPKNPPARRPQPAHASTVSLADVLAAMQRSRYHVRQRGDYDLNVVGIRRAPIRVNEFNDVLLAFYPSGGQWQCSQFQITTVPGYTYLEERLLNSDGTAILVPAQYRDKYTIRAHDGRYQAFCQKQDPGVYVKVWRDDTLDGAPNPDTTRVHNARGINVHRADPAGCTAAVNGYSAGCQVFRCAAEFDAFMAIARRARTAWENSFTYTLLNESAL